MADYQYEHTNCFEITLEISCCKYPPASELEQLWIDNKDALLTFVEQVGVVYFVFNSIREKLLNLNLHVAVFWFWTYNMSFTDSSSHIVRFIF